MSVTFRVVLIVALIAGVISSAIVIERYGAGSYFPGLVAGFAGTLVAFMLALTWERERDRRHAVRAEAELEKQRGTEVRRRCEPIAVELEKNGESLATLNEVYKASADGTAAAAGLFTIANPQLLDGAWTANASRLSELVSDYRRKNGQPRSSRRRSVSCAQSATC
jgi:uncharacterized membrane protein YeaQ/YmgE (transglycosylase-associated protein family)